MFYGFENLLGQLLSWGEKEGVKGRGRKRKAHWLFKLLLIAIGSYLLYFYYHYLKTGELM